MLIPTPQDISGIIAKLKELQTTIASIEDRPLEFPKQKENKDESIPVEQLIRVAAGHRHKLSGDEIAKFTKSELGVEGLALHFPQIALQKVTELLPILSMDKLKKLLKDDISQLLADDTVPKIKTAPGSISSVGTFGAGPIVRDTEVGRNLKSIQFSVEQQIEKNIEKAKADRWLKHVRPLIDKIEELLFPFWDYLKKHSSYGQYAKVILMEIIGNGMRAAMPEVIREFRRIKYKIEVEEKQKQNQTETEPQKKDGKSNSFRNKNKIIKSQKELKPNYREANPGDIPEVLRGYQILAEDTQKFEKTKEKPLPRITLQSPSSDVVRVIELIVKNYKLMKLADIEQAVRFISSDRTSIITSIHTYFFESTAPKIDRVCYWLRRNYKDLYDQVYHQWQNLTNLIEQTDQFILDALEKKGLKHILPYKDKNDKLWRLFVCIKQFTAILEDTAIALKEDTGRLAPKKKRKKKKGKSLNITPRQKEAGNYRDQGNNNKEIATLMGISEQRVGVLLKEYDQKVNAISKSINISKTVPYPTRTNELGEEEITI